MLGGVVPAPERDSSRIRCVHSWNSVCHIMPLEHTKISRRGRQNVPSNPLNRLPQRFEIFIVQSHHTVLRFQSERAVQCDLGFRQVPKLALVAGEIEVKNRRARHALDGVHKDNAGLLN